MSEEVLALGLLFVVSLWLAYKELVAKKKTYSKTEWELRCKLAALNRIVHNSGWDEDGHNQAVAVCGKKNGQPVYLTDGTTRPLCESKASLLTKWMSRPHQDGAPGREMVLVCPGANPPAMVRHPLAFESANLLGCLDVCPEMKVAVHSHHPDVVACCSMHNFPPPKTFGLKDLSVRMFLSPKKLTLKELFSTYEEGVEVGRDYLECGKYQVCMMTNHGVFVVGRNVEEAYYLIWMFHRFCRLWLNLMSGTAGNADLIQFIPEKDAVVIQKHHDGAIAYTRATPGVPGLGEGPWSFVVQNVPPGYDE